MSKRKAPDSGYYKAEYYRDCPDKYGTTEFPPGTKPAPAGTEILLYGSIKPKKKP